jgi:hypothetical protein
MASFHLHFAWVWILVGLVAGTLLGMFFHDEAWLGGYASWRRRMLRLGHVSFLGTGLLNFAFAISVDHVGLEAPPSLSAVLFVLGAVTMPLVCFLSAWRKGFRNLFFVPVLSLIVATGDLLFRGLLQ